MMRSLYSGVSGLKTHQTRMDVIGNNIANVNTVSYKSMSVNFSDLMYQTTQTATGPNADTGLGGTNPRQIGLGVKQASINTNITEEGASQSTGNPFDIKIAGDTFFIVSDGANTYFTRDGSFNVDAAGNLVMSSNGYTVMGWKAEESDDGTLVIKKDTVSALKVMDESNMTYPAEYTQAAVASGIIDWFDENQQENAGKTISLQIYDNLGYSYSAKFALHNAHKAQGVGDDYSFYTELKSITDAGGNTIDISKAVYGTTQSITLDGEEYGLNNATVKTLTPATITGVTATTCAYVNYVKEIAGGGTATCSVLIYPAGSANTDISYNGTPLATGTALFNANGSVNVGQTFTLSDGSTMTGAEMFAALYGTSIKPADITQADIDTSGTITVTQKTVSGSVTLTYDGADGSLVSPKTATLDLSGLGDAFTSIEIDFTKTSVSDNKGKSTVSMEKGNTNGGKTGRSLGALSSIAIQTDGQIFASYTNGQKKLLGQIAVADFANAAGLQKEGDNLYSSTTNSGDFNGIGTDITTAGGSMATGVLEMSNVDLSSQFTDMITTQRGFQANSRIITVSDTLLEELINLKR